MSDDSERWNQVHGDAVDGYGKFIWPDCQIARLIARRSG